MTETELGAAGRTEAKAGGARDGLTDRQRDRASRPQARSSGAGAGGAPAEDGEGVPEAAADGMRIRGGRGAKSWRPDRRRAQCLCKVGIEYPSCTPGAAQNAFPRPAPLLALAAELKITARSPPADRDPNPSPDPSPTGRGAKPQLPVPQKKKKKEKKRKGGVGGEGGGGRAGGGGPGHMDVISPLRGRRAAPQLSAPARRPPGPRLPPFLPPSLSFALAP